MQQTDPALLRVLETARAFLAYRERVTAIAAGQIPPPRDLGEAIDRDFLLFDLERAARALREAVHAIPAGTGTAPQRRRRRRSSVNPG